MLSRGHIWNLSAFNTNQHSNNYRTIIVPQWESSVPFRSLQCKFPWTRETLSGWNYRYWTNTYIYTCALGRVYTINRVDIRYTTGQFGEIHKWEFRILPCERPTGAVGAPKPSALAGPRPLVLVRRRGRPRVGRACAAFSRKMSWYQKCTEKIMALYSPAVVVVYSTIAINSSSSIIYSATEV